MSVKVASIEYIKVRHIGGNVMCIEALTVIDGIMYVSKGETKAEAKAELIYKIINKMGFPCPEANELNPWPAIPKE